MFGRGGRADASPNEVTIRHHIRYRFDNLLARGTGAALVWLGAVTFAAVLASALLLTISGVKLAGSESGSLVEDTWQSLLRILDSGTMAGDVGWGRRILALLVTLFGILVAGTLIGIIAAGVEDRIDGMRRGRSVVIESDHIVILGGSSRIPIIIQQLVLANAHRASNTIVVLADQDPTELREAVVDAVPDRLTTRVVYRSGDPTLRSDLSLVRLDTARGAIVLSDAAVPDVAVVQTVLAVDAELGDLHALPVVVEVNRAAVAERLVRACGPTVHPIVTSQGIARVAAFALRQRGLSQVIAELTDFRASDLHITELPELVGLRFDEIVGRFTNARPLGLTRADGRIELNPPADSVVAAGDRLVVIARDPATLEIAQEASRLPSLGSGDGQARPMVEAVEEHILVVGWNDLGPHLLTGWAAAAAPSSTVEIAFDPRLIEPDEVVIPTIDVDVRLSPTSDASSVLSDRLPTTIVALGYTSVSTGEADARTLLDVMHLRKRCAERDPVTRFIVQMLDDARLDLGETTGRDDFLISAAVGSQFIAQIMEQPERRGVLLELYSGDGPSVRMVGCDRLGLVGDHTAGDIVATAYASGLLAIGWRRSVAEGGELELNPTTSDRIDLTPDDEIVVVG